MISEYFKVSSSIKKKCFVLPLKSQHNLLQIISSSLNWLVFTYKFSYLLKVNLNFKIFRENAIHCISLSAIVCSCICVCVQLCVCACMETVADRENVTVGIKYEVTYWLLIDIFTFELGRFKMSRSWLFTFRQQLSQKLKHVTVHQMSANQHLCFLYASVYAAGKYLCCFYVILYAALYQNLCCFYVIIYSAFIWESSYFFRIYSAFVTESILLLKISDTIFGHNKNKNKAKIFGNTPFRLPSWPLE